jgi:hypothetical protein
MEQNKTLATQLKINNFPFEIKDNNGNQIYYEFSKGYWRKKEFYHNNKIIYNENSIGFIEDNRVYKFKFKKNYILEFAFKEKEEFIKGFKKVSKPIFYKRKYPDGEYQIRTKGKIEIYFCFKNKWYFIEEKENITNSMKICEWNLFPILPEKEYVELKKMYKRLTKEWQMNVDAYFQFISSKEAFRNSYYGTLLYMKKQGIV